MARKLPFYQTDVARACKAVKSCGAEIARVEIGPDGAIIIVTAAAVPEPALSPLETWKAKREAR